MACGDGADAELQAGAVLDQLGAVAADGLLRLGDGWGRHLGDGVVHLDEEVDVVLVDDAVAVGARHAGG